MQRKKYPRLWLVTTFNHKEDMHTVLIHHLLQLRPPNIIISTSNRMSLQILMGKITNSHVALPMGGNMVLQPHISQHQASNICATPSTTSNSTDQMNFATPPVTPQTTVKPFIPATPLVLRNVEQYQQPTLGSQLYPGTQNPNSQTGPHIGGSPGNDSISSRYSQVLAPTQHVGDSCPSR